MINNLLIRWWYVLPEYPPTNFDFKEALSFNKLREVPERKFKFEPEEINGCKKVYSLEHYKGVY